MSPSPRTAASAPAYPFPGTEEVEAAVARIRAEADARTAHPREVREARLRAVRRMLSEHQDRFAAALAQDLGKSRTEALLTEVGSVVSEIDHALAHLDAWMKPRKAPVPLAFQPASARVVPVPLGAVLVIGAWNYPVQLTLAPVVGAIAAGNTVVLSPSEKAPATAAALQELLPAALDGQGIAVVEGGADCVQALIAHPWDHILYTGGERVGRIVYEAAAKTLTPVTLELGGKSPAVVTEVKDPVGMARRIAFGKFTNAGQTCVAPDYVLAVGPEAHAQVVRHLPEAIAEFYGADPAQSPDYGRLVSEDHARRLVGMLEEDVAAGAHVVIGGESDVPGRYIAPTLVDGVGLDGALMREELFGPILPVVRVESLQEAIDVIAARPHPLASYLFTDDDDDRAAFSAQVQAGVVSHDVTLLHAGMPGLRFGGVGHSGIGAYHGEAGFETFSHLRPELTKGTGADTLRAVYPPHGPVKRTLLPKLM
ncbi:aldehyde dehydrogenase family protein [Micrococcus sp.]|uniref:aldehyde dehydrogenase family protein n=1 Tax=Micrococcus sp. TaxID=1271 RepID=UPI0026DD3240|nr:aldehyde dehydrogenase family protein [Micrococcus sp.]MDO4239868.1 aldehyde dehydrogenase family protein [Micrococcus sp.]